MSDAARAKAEEILRRHFKVWEPMANSTGEEESGASLARSLLVAFTEALDTFAANQTAAACALLADAGPQGEASDYSPEGLSPAAARSEAVRQAEYEASALERDAKRYRQARTMPWVLDPGRLAPLRPDKFDSFIDAAVERARQR